MTDDKQADAARLYQQGDPTAAAELYIQLLRDAPTDPELLYGLGICRMAMRDFVDAKRLFEQSRQHDLSGGINATFYLAEIARQQEDPEVAISLYEQVLAIAPHHLPARQTLDALRSSSAIRSERPLAESPGQDSAPAANSAKAAASGAMPQPTAAATSATGGAPSITAEKRKSLADLLDDHDAAVSTEQLQGQLLYRRRRVWRSYIPSLWPVVLIAVVTVVLGLLTHSAIRSGGSLGDAAKTLATAHRIALAALAPVALILVGLSVLRSLTTEVLVYERRVEYRSGVISRLIRTYWLWEYASPPEFIQTPDQVIARTGAITFGRYHVPFRHRERQFRNGGALVGLGSPEFMMSLAEQLRFMMVTERRAMLDRLMNR